MKTQTVIAKTTKGHRVFLEGIGRIGQRYSVEYSNSHVIVTFHTTGKRKVVASKGGVIDLEGKKVTQWADGSTCATVSYSDEQIQITRA
jgi:hypothetical protein